MDKDIAIEILKAVACCTITELSCYDCPLCEKETSKCRPWRNEEVVEAVKVLNERGADNG